MFHSRVYCYTSQCDKHWGFCFWGLHFATFNLADAALVIGVFILIIVEVINMIKEAKEKAKRGEYDLPPMEVEAKQKENAENKDK